MESYFKDLKGGSTVNTSDLLIALLKAKVKISDGANSLTVYNALIKKIEELNNSKKNGA